MRAKTENLKFKDSAKRAILKQPEYTPEKFHAAPKDPRCLGSPVLETPLS